MALNLGEGLSLELKTRSRKFGATFLRFYIDTYSEYSKFLSSLVVNCYFSINMVVAALLKRIFLNEIEIFSQVDRVSKN